MKPQQQTDTGPPLGARPPAYVVELWVSEQLRDRLQRNGQSLAEVKDARRESGEPDLEAEP
jgi:hypothetical protein